MYKYSTTAASETNKLVATTGLRPHELVKVRATQQALSSKRPKYWKNRTQNHT